MTAEPRTLPPYFVAVECQPGAATCSPSAIQHGQIRSTSHDGTAASATHPSLPCVQSATDRARASTAHRAVHRTPWPIGALRWCSMASTLNSSFICAAGTAMQVHGWGACSTFAVLAEKSKGAYRNGRAETRLVEAMFATAQVPRWSLRPFKGS